MKGFFSTTETGDFAAADAAGKRDGSRLAFTVTIDSDSVDQLVSDPAHRARLSGTVRAAALSPDPMPCEGDFQLLVADPAPGHARQMVYRMRMTTAAGEALMLDGTKMIRNHAGLDLWPDTTTLFTTVTKAGGEVVGRGILHIEPADFLKQMTTMKATNAANPIEGLAAVAKFGMFFAGELFDVYGLVAARATELDPDAAPREKRPLRMGAPTVYPVMTDDGTEVRVTRYQGGTKGPVILAPGFGTSTLAFSIDTVDTNLPEFLFEAGYDVWLFDYRASPALESAQTQFTLDDIAKRDYPAAVARVREVSGADSVQVMAHCVGSMTFLMAMMAGLQGVRSAFCSALTFFPVSPLANRIRAALDLGTLIQKFGKNSLTTDFNPGEPVDRFLDTVLRTFPTRERCDSAVCRRILGIYGEVYKHEMLNDATHKAIHEMFGVANVTSFNQITRMIRAGHIVDANGDDTYLPNIARLAIPITFFHGEENQLFLPEGSERTFQQLTQANDAALYTRVTVPTYAHMDCFLGKDAATDIYPLVANALAGHDVTLGRN
jgi:cholesterol oxidase